MKITVEKGDITRFEADAIVNPANSYGYMSGGVAGAIKSKGGIEIEQEALDKAPIPIGHAVATTAGRLDAKYVIHTPTMEQPGSNTSEDKVIEATNAALECADELGLKKVSIPGMGSGVGAIAPEKAADAIVKTIRKFKPVNLQEIILIDVKDSMVKAFNDALKR